MSDHDDVQCPICGSMTQLRNVKEVSGDGTEKPNPYDLTQSQFERDKTQRIAALCEALKAVCECSDGAGPADYTSQNRVSEIMNRLSQVCGSYYAPQPPPS